MSNLKNNLKNISQEKTFHALSVRDIRKSLKNGVKFELHGKKVAAIFYNSVADMMTVQYADETAYIINNRDLGTLNMQVC